MKSSITVNKDSFSPIGKDIVRGIIGKNALELILFGPVKTTA